MASRKTGEKVYKELLKSNPDFKFNANIMDAAGVGRTGKLHGYDNFNYALGDSESQAVAKASKIFYDKLKEKGYGAVLDVNDTKYSYLRGQSPVILFDKSKVNLKDVNVTDMTAERRAEVKKYAESLAAVHRSLDKIAANPATTTGKVTAIAMLNGLGYGSYIYDQKVKRDFKKKQKVNKK